MRETHVNSFYNGLLIINGIKINDCNHIVELTTTISEGYGLHYDHVFEIYTDKQLYIPETGFISVSRGDSFIHHQAYVKLHEYNDLNEVWNYTLQGSDMVTIIYK